jgi:hemerythrin
MIHNAFVEVRIQHKDEIAEEFKNIRKLVSNYAKCHFSSEEE